MKYFLPLFFVISCYGQKLMNNEKKIASSSKVMKVPGHIFFSCIIENDFDTCVSNFKRQAKNEYEENLVANTLFSADSLTSFAIHKRCYKKRPNELFFIREYAMELERKGKYAEATKLYEEFIGFFPDNFRVKVWLADCYMNTGMVEKSIDYWQRLDHARHRVEIENALHDIYGKADQLRKRNFYRNEIKKGNAESFYDLFFLDLNWESDWWNNGPTEEEYLKEDIRLLNDKVDKKSDLYSVIDAYVKIKNLGKQDYANGLAEIGTTREAVKEDISVTTYNEVMKEVEKEILDIINTSVQPEDSAKAKVEDVKSTYAAYIESTLIDHNLFLKGNPLPLNGKVANDFLKVCITNSITTREVFFKERGAEILNRAHDFRDVEFLSMYASLIPSLPTVLADINKKGWKEFKDERFAWSYLEGNLIARKLNDTDLDQALVDFPNSSRIALLKVQKTKLDNKEIRPFVIELIKKELRRLDSGVGLGASYGTGHNSNALRLYFEILKNTGRVKPK